MNDLILANNFQVEFVYFEVIFVTFQHSNANADQMVDVNMYLKMNRIEHDEVRRKTREPHHSSSLCHLIFSLWSNSNMHVNVEALQAVWKVTNRFECVWVANNLGSFYSFALKCTHSNEYIWIANELKTLLVISTRLVVSVFVPHSFLSRVKSIVSTSKVVGLDA